jgi:hydroxyethylthiazole kinase-like sugar kinase family protein
VFLSVTAQTASLCASRQVLPLSSTCKEAAVYTSAYKAAGINLTNGSRSYRANLIKHLSETIFISDYVETPY